MEISRDRRKATSRCCRSAGLDVDRSVRRRALRHRSAGGTSRPRRSARRCAVPTRRCAASSASRGSQLALQAHSPLGATALAICAALSLLGVAPRAVATGGTLLAGLARGGDSGASRRPSVAARARRAAAAHPLRRRRSLAARRAPPRSATRRRAGRDRLRAGEAPLRRRRRTRARRRSLRARGPRARTRSRLSAQRRRPALGSVRGAARMDRSRARRAGRVCCGRIERAALRWSSSELETEFFERGFGERIEVGVAAGGTPSAARSASDREQRARPRRSSSARATVRAGSPGSASKRQTRHSVSFRSTTRSKTIVQTPSGSPTYAARACRIRLHGSVRCSGPSRNAIPSGRPRPRAGPPRDTGRERLGAPSVVASRIRPSRSLSDRDPQFLGRSVATPEQRPSDIPPALGWAMPVTPADVGGRDALRSVAQRALLRARAPRDGLRPRADRVGGGRRDAARSAATRSTRRSPPPPCSASSSR